MMSRYVTRAALPRITGRAVAALTVATAVLAAAACSADGSAPRAPAKTGASAPTATGASAPTAAPAATIAGCRVGAWAEDFTDAGHLAWQVSLPANPGLGETEPVSPLAVGAVSVFAGGNALYALRLRNGQPMWHREFGPASNPGQDTVDELWTWQGSVIAALGTDSAAPELVSLDPATGAVRWTVALATAGLEDPPAVTTDGVVAILTQTGTLRAFDLAAGRQLWSAQYGKGGLLAAGDVVIGSLGHGSNITDLTRSVAAFGARSGKELWSRSGLPAGTQLVPAPGGRLLTYDVPVPPRPGPRQPAPAPVTALDAATGQTLWTLSAGRQVTAVWAAPAGVVVATGLPGTVLVEDPGARLYLADLVTGRVRWSAAGHTDPYATAVITAANVITVATTPATGMVTDHAARTGATVWKAVISDTYGRYLANPEGPNVLVTFPPAAAGKPSVLLAVDLTTGATRATHPLPYTATVGAPVTVAGADALVEPETVSCAVPVAPGSAPAGNHLGASAAG